MSPSRLRWDGQAIVYVDVRSSPDQTRSGRANDLASTVDAIRSGAVAGSDCIDLLAGFGIAFACRDAGTPADVARAAAVLGDAAHAAGARRLPTLGRVLSATPGAELATVLAVLEERFCIDAEIADRTRRLIVPGGVLTNGRDTVGAAAGAIIAAHASGTAVHAFVREAGPGSSGRIAHELRRAGVPCTTFADAAAAPLLGAGRVNAVIVDAETIAANGDVVAEIGTFALALAAAHHRIPMYAAVPRAAVDMQLSNGAAVDLDTDEPAPAQRRSFDHYAPISDVTPGRLMCAIVTEYGALRPPYPEALATLSSRPALFVVRRGDG